MKRRLALWLDSWLADAQRRPLILRGARQVGKTWLIRDLAARNGRDLVELNFEREPRLRRYFESNDPRKVTTELSLALGRDITVDGSLLFLDEMQAAGELLAKLRWFYEEMPRLPVVAAGSLLEFTLAEHDFSMPVGRVSFCHVGPMTFPEYLNAHGQERLSAAMAEWRVGRSPSPAVHDQASEWFHRYTMIGGMPAVVAADVAGRDADACRDMQVDLTAAYRADFAKYCGKLDPHILDSVLLAVAGSVGRKFVYAHVDDGVKQHQAKRGLELLAAAGVCDIVRHTAANGLPLAAEASDRRRKAVLVDVGLLHGIVGTLSARAFPALDALTPDVRGKLAEQMVAQQLRGIDPDGHRAADLYYWQREGGRPGELDFVAAIHGRVVPVEVKSGSAGALKSLHQFMYDKRLDVAVRCDQNPPSMQTVAVKTTLGQFVEYRLLSLPPYLLWKLATLVGDQ